MPDSAVLMGMLLAVNLPLHTLLTLEVFPEVWRALVAELLDLGLGAGLLFAALQVRGHPGRWRQTYIALLGMGALFGVVALVYRLLALALGLEPLAALLDLLLLFWSLLVMGHILRQALEIPLLLAILIAVAYTMFLLGLLAQLLLPEAAGQPVFE
ncbi:hypothetical protein [endosymbiont of unidentified scaly snail isolate Monju]|uniref:hypothetical protein n=1 Tax=endosymbiont of unidentified scaly snail isolate Monju TaxID=1248727 RepID=UPI0011DD9AC9|nr:hypothetical protein [endosymbiont of unidentified scaly snail isolate Monju]